MDEYGATARDYKVLSAYTVPNGDPIRVSVV